MIAGVEKLLKLKYVTVMGVFFRLWTSFSERQKIAAATIGGWIGAWVVEKLLDFAAAKAPAAVAFSAIAYGIRTYITNGYVAMLLVGSFLVGFGPNIWAFIRKQRPSEIFGAVIAIFFLVTMLTLGVSLLVRLYTNVFETPRLFTPPKEVTKNVDGSSREFIQDTPTSIERIYANNTKLKADDLLRDKVGKWIAVTGIVSDIAMQDYENKAIIVHVTEERLSSASLAFDSRWGAKLSGIQKNDRIYAICKFFGGDADTISANDCELTHP